MGRNHHLSRREILNSIWGIGSGSLLLPLSVFQGERRNTQSVGIRATPTHITILSLMKIPMTGCGWFRLLRRWMSVSSVI
jgi:hypothetical protein